jgi:hypothetical protein
MLSNEERQILADAVETLHDLRKALTDVGDDISKVSGSSAIVALTQTAWAKAREAQMQIEHALNPATARWPARPETQKE